MATRFDPFDAAQTQDAWPLLKELRDEAPVAEVGTGMQYVTRHAECRAVLRDTEFFSNASGFKAPGVVVPAEDRTLGELDPPDHTLVRRVMITALSPRAVRDAESFIAATARHLVAALPVPGPVDLVPALTVPLPNRVTVHLLGLPDADAAQIAAWAKELMESGFPATNRTERGEGFVNAFPDFAGYIDDQIERRATAATGTYDDVLTALLHLEVDGHRLSRRRVRAMTRNLITGGLTTTSQLIGNLLHQLLTVPGLESTLRSDASAVDRAIDESLRLTPPVLFAPRGCLADTEVGGCPVRAGQRVVVGTASANRDERVFTDPDVFDIDRKNAEEHLTFGFGPHVCPGAMLARAVARVAIAEVLARFAPGAVQLAPGYVRENVPTFFEIGPRTLVVRTG